MSPPASGRRDGGPSLARVSVSCLWRASLDERILAADTDLRSVSSSTPALGSAGSGSDWPFAGTGKVYQTSRAEAISVAVWNQGVRNDAGRACEFILKAMKKSKGAPGRPLGARTLKMAGALVKPGISTEEISRFPFTEFTPRSRGHLGAAELRADPIAVSLHFQSQSVHR